MKIVITGSDGFIGRNLVVRLQEADLHELRPLGRDADPATFSASIADADFVFHLAGVNRTPDEREFVAGNVEATEHLCRALDSAGNRAPIVYASSTQATLDNVYGRSKRAAEDALVRHGDATGAPVTIFRLTNVFGKWAKPNYNSAVATFCHNVANGLPITVHDPAATLRLLYIDDVLDAFVGMLDAPAEGAGFRVATPVYETTVGEVADIICGFAKVRKSLVIPPVGTGLVRALYSTYLTYLPPAAFDYEVAVHSDPRGDFVEMLKTADSGQFSYFTAGPGVTRGNHYHHTKAEKFLVISGTAHFGFRHVVTGESHELVVRGGEGKIVETIPGWTHNITNVGEEQLIVMLWANEIFDRQRPDTIAMKV